MGTNALYNIPLGIAVVLTVGFLITEICYVMYICGIRGKWQGFPGFYWTLENWCGVFRCLLPAMALAFIYLYRKDGIHVWAAYLMAGSVCLCVYQICYRYKFNVLASLCMGVSAAITFLVALTLWDKPDNLRIFFANENALSKKFGLIDAVIACYPAFVGLFGVLLNIGKKLGGKIDAAVDEVDEKTHLLCEDRRALLKNRRPVGMWICLFVIWVASIAELCCLPDLIIFETKIRLRVYLIFISVQLSFIGMFWQSELSERMLLKAECAYLGYLSTRLHAPVILNFGLKKTYLWKEFCQVYLNICSGVKKVASNEQYMENATDILFDVRNAQRIKMTGYCDTREMAAMVKYHQKVYEDRFQENIASQGEESLLKHSWHISTTQYIISALNTLDTWGMDSLQMLLHFYNCFHAAVRWEEKTPCFCWNTLGPNRIYTLSFERWLKTFILMDEHHKGGGKNGCLMWRYCLNSTEKCSANPDEKASAIRMCGILMTYPQRIAEQVVQFKEEGVKAIFKTSEYEKYFFLLFDYAQCDIASVLFAAGNGRFDEWGELFDILEGLTKNQRLLQAAKQCLEKLDQMYEDSLGRGDLATEEERKKRARLGKGASRYRRLEKRTRLIDNENILICLKLLLYITAPK